MSNSSNDIVNEVLEKIKKLREEKEAKKLAEKETKRLSSIKPKAPKAEKKPRDLVKVNAWQKRYNEKNREEGLIAVCLNIKSDLLTLLDKEIYEETKNKKTLNRSNVINDILFKYFNKEDTND